MPSPGNVISGLTELAQQWRWLAAAWHVALAALLIAFYLGWRPTTRTFLVTLVVPLISVSTLAWLSGNPFNGAALALLAASLSGRALLEPEHRVGPGRATSGCRACCWWPLAPPTPNSPRAHRGLAS